MKYALLIYSPTASYDELSEEERDSVSREYFAISEDPRCVGGAQLQPIETATTVRVDGAKTLTTDGPFADSKEVFGGFYLFEAGDLDQVIEVAGRIPAARMGGKVEVRPLVER
jgi:hypothetical protein